MTKVIKQNVWLLRLAIAWAGLLAFLFFANPVGAINKIPDPDPLPGSFGLEATKPQDPPTSGATITTPGGGASFNRSPITVSGICPSGLLVQIYNNNVMAGSVMCVNGSFSLEIGLFTGQNELKAIVYDDLEQAGPESTVVTVSYSNAQFSAFGQLITLTSSYGRRSSPAGSMLNWPLQLTGGTGPYAFSLDWGDGSKAELKSQSLAGLVTVAHAYKKAGIYNVNIAVTDTNGVSAFLQLVAVSSGKVDTDASASVDDKKGEGGIIRTILWAPMAIAIAMLIPAYLLGRRSQLVSVRNKMIKERDSYQEKQN